jgi:uncharacterized membrane protein SpoIIM required for sporulation
MTREAQRQRWQTLGALLDRAERRGLGSLSVAEVQQLGRLYRQVAIDLSRARAGGADPDEVRFLNNLAARAHGQVYRPRRGDPRVVLWFLLTGFPRLLRRHSLPVLVAASVFLGAAVATFVAVVREPQLAYSLFDENLVEYENLRLEQQHGEYRGNFTFGVHQSVIAAVLIIGNNLLVGVRAFAFGALLCLPCLLILLYNGRMLGTLEGLVLLHGYFLDFNSLILTHGVLELSAICISGGSGLLLGWAVLAPGDSTRAAALRRAAPDAFGLLAGAAAMLVVAGLIEAYVTPHFGQPVRWAVAGTTAVLLATYLGLAPGLRFARNVNRKRVFPPRAGRPAALQ